MGNGEWVRARFVRKQTIALLIASNLPGLASPIRDSIQLVNQAIDSNQKSKSDVQTEQRNKHQFRQLESYGLRYSQKNNRGSETNKRSKNPGDNF